MSSPLTYSPILERRIRAGDPRDQAVSTYARIAEAIDARDAESAAALADYTLDEARVIYDIQRQWQAGLRALLLEKGCEPEAVADVDARALALLAHPDGRPHDQGRTWAELHESVLRLQSHLFRGDWDEARQELAEAREIWRVSHDRDNDWTHLLINEFVVRFGEEVMPAIWEKVGRPLFDWRYDKFDVDLHDWRSEGLPANLYIALEAMRAHLNGPRREGDPIELTEFDDRWEMRFDPCGSGGRAVRGDQVEGTPPRMEPPFGIRVIEGAYAWTDGKAGVCAYCNHCQVVMEHMPMDKFGYPVRVIEPPIYPDTNPDRLQRCSWTIYKDPTTVPEQIYTRAGRTKPAVFGSRSLGTHSSEQPERPLSHGGG